MHRLVLIAALSSVAITSALARPPMETNQLVDDTGAPIGTASNPVAVTGGTVRSAGTNRSATVGTTASTLMASNAMRQGWKVKNDCANAVWISFDGTAAATAGSGNVKVAPGAYLASEPGFVETGAMSAVAETSACAVTAREH